MKKIILVLYMTLLSIVYAQRIPPERLDPIAAREVRLGTPSFSGSGCNQGTTSAGISDDRQTLSILFDDYIVEAGGNLRRRVARKGCNITIPVVVPRGYTVAVFKVDYRGFNSLPRGATTQFNMDYFFEGRLGPRNVETFRGPVENEFITNNEVSSQNQVWSQCGRPFQLRAHSSMTVTTNRENEQSLSAIDSADFSAGLRFKLQWRRCGGPRGGG